MFKPRGSTDRSLSKFMFSISNTPGWDVSLSKGYTPAPFIHLGE